MQIKILVNTAKMPDEAKTKFFDELEELATRDRSGWAVSTRCDNIFDGRQLRKNLYLIFGEICDNDMLCEFIRIVGEAKKYAGVVVLRPDETKEV